MKELLEDVKLNRIAYYLEKIEMSKNEDKIRYFNKIEKMKINKKQGLFLIENSIRDYNYEDEFGGISVSLIEICFKNYQKEYNEKIRQVFKDLSQNAKDRVLFLLTTIDEKETLDLYADLVIKYYKDIDDIPTGVLPDKPLSYYYLFPKLFKAIKYGSIKNSIFSLMNKYISYGVVPKTDLKKYKRQLTASIIEIFSEALKYKSKDTFSLLHITEYRDLRYYLEIAVNLEIYISSKKTKEYLDKLYSKNDNQLKLFILDNYYKKGININKMDISKIEKDITSRYALFELLSIYGLTSLMSKKYLDQKKLAESELFTNLLLSTLYLEKPKNIKFLKKTTINGYNYYAYTFDYTYKYSNINPDYLTNYICNQIGIEKYVGTDITSKFIGISGGYSTIEPSKLIFNHRRLLIEKIQDEENIDEKIENIINKQELLFPVIEKKNNKIKVKKPKKEKIKAKKIKLKEPKVKKENKLFKNLFVKKEKEVKEEKIKTKKIKLKEPKIKKEKKKKIKTKKIKLKEPKVKKEKKIFKKKHLKIPKEKIKKKESHIFVYILLFLFAVFIGLLIYFILYVYGVGSINDGISESVIKPVKIEEKGKFTEIRGVDIFSQEQSEYFVLLFKGAKKEKTKYYRYINEYTKRNYTFYYVDLSNEENKFLYSPNELNFVLYTDRLLKVKDREYEYYVDGNKHILYEMQTQIESIIEEERKKAKENKTILPIKKKTKKKKETNTTKKYNIKLESKTKL